MSVERANGRVVRAGRCELRAVDRIWPYAIENAAAIEAHWQRRLAVNPKFFNGRIRMLAAYEISGDTLKGEFLETGFREFLYWRDHGEPEAGVRDSFGSAIIYSSDGALLLARQRPGNVNTGVAYLPGGFIDPRDVGADGSIDIRASTGREISEETGIGPDVFKPRRGYLLTVLNGQLSIGVAYDCALTADALQDRVMAHLAADPLSELQDVVMVRRAQDIVDMDLAPYARLLLSTLLP